MVYFAGYDYKDNRLLFLKSSLLYLLRSGIGAGLFKEGICQICKKEAIYDSQKKNTTRFITACCTKTLENMIKKFTESKNEVLYREVWCDLFAREFRIMTTVIRH